MTDRDKILLVICRWKDSMKHICVLTELKCVSMGNDPHKCPLIPQDLYTFVITLERQRHHLEDEVDYYLAQVERHIRERYEEYEKELKNVK